MSEERKDDKRDDEIGAAWKKTGKYGDFWSGSLNVVALKAAIEKADGAERINITININKRKSKPSQPDFRIAVAKPFTPRPREADSKEPADW